MRFVFRTEIPEENLDDEKRWVRLNSEGVKEGSAQTRVVSREFSLEGDNQVPIMIVNEDDRRIKNIPMINPHNLEGVGMGESPYAGDPLHLSLKFLSEYTDNKADEIEAMILDPHYSLSHHVVLKETGNDTRIFATEIPEVNQDDDPDNDVTYDSFEVKINYPLPYPQIIEKVGESRERIMADSCEIEYVKKNGEIINDFDDDGEIQEKERLHFPVWQGPDYEENDVKPYYISNMVFTQEQCKPLDQTQFLNENKRFKIKVYYKNSDRNEIFIDLNTLSVNNDNNEATVIEEYKNIKLENIGNNMYISDFCIGTIGDIGKQNRDFDYYKYSFKMSFNNVFNLLSTKNRIQVKVNQIKKEIGNGKYPAYAVFAMHNLENGEIISNDGSTELPFKTQLAWFFDLVRNINSLEYNVNADFSGTREEFFENVVDKELIYICAHGNEESINLYSIEKNNNFWCR